MELWDAVRLEMLDLADRLAELDDDQWNSPSLCSEWRIRDVLAHMTAGAQGAFGPGAIVRGMLRHRFDHNRWIAVDGRERGQQDPEVLVQSLRDAAADPTTSSRGRPLPALAHVVVHGQDMCRPLGIARDLPEEHLAPVADFVRTSFVFRAKKRIAGVKLTATDMEWSRGEGEEVTGPAEALIMMMAGRTVALADLSGEGKAALGVRL